MVFHSNSLYVKVMSSRVQLQFATRSDDLDCSGAQDCDLGGPLQRMRDMRRPLPDEDTQDEHQHDQERHLPA